MSGSLCSIRKWMGSMNPQPPQLTIQHTVAEGDFAITRGDMLMRQKQTELSRNSSQQISPSTDLFARM